MDGSGSAGTRFCAEHRDEHLQRADWKRVTRVVYANGHAAEWLQQSGGIQHAGHVGLHNSRLQPGCGDRSTVDDHGHDVVLRIGLV